jgi:hypothetical protein
MKDINNMSEEELEKYILSLPINSVCARATIEGLKKILRDKQLNAVATLGEN